MVYIWSGNALLDRLMYSRGARTWTVHHAFTFKCAIVQDHGYLIDVYVKLEISLLYLALLIMLCVEYYLADLPNAAWYIIGYLKTQTISANQKP